MKKIMRRPRLSDTAIINGRNSKQIEERIAWLRDDNTCMRNILRTEKDTATRNECAGRIRANTDEIRQLEHDLLAVVSADL